MSDERPHSQIAAGLTLAHEEDELRRLIGQVVIDFQLTELFVAERLAGLLGWSGFGDRHLIVAAMSFGQKVNLMCELLARRQDQKPSVSPHVLRTGLNAAEEFRNSVVHSAWVVRGRDLRWTREKSR